MDCEIRNELGTIYIPEDVVASVAGYACLECYGIVAMGSKNSMEGITDIFKRDNLAKGLSVVSEGASVSINVSVIVEYGVSISAVAASAMEAIKYHVENLTGVAVNKVNVAVVGIRV